MTVQEIVLRSDQQEIKNGIYGNWNAGKKHVLGVLPTGGGKSVIMSDLILDGERSGIKQLVQAHRKELVGQMSMHVARRGIFHNIIAPRNVVAEITGEHRAEFGRSFVNPNGLCSVASVDTIKSRADDFAKDALQFGRVYTDEGHHVLRDNKWGFSLSLFKNALFASFSASPSRADGMGLGSHCDGLIDAMVVGPTMRELINMRALCDYEIVIPETDFIIDENNAGKEGDFTPAAMKAASERSKIVGDVVIEYIKHAYGKRGITFATDVETAEKIAKQFNLFGIPAAAVSADTPSNVRTEYIKRFKAGKLLQLVNVDLFGEGFDLPAIEVVSMARPTKSLAVYLQQFGRALRILAGKMYGLVIDHVSNWKRHGFPDKPHFWTLDRREKRGSSAPDPELQELTRCRSCSKPYLKVLPACPHCGAVMPVPEGGVRSLEQVDGDMRYLDRETIAKMQKAAQLISPAGKAAQVGHVTGNKYAAAAAVNQQTDRILTQQRLMHAVANWVGLQRAIGRSDVESEKRFYGAMKMSTLDSYALKTDEMLKTAEIVEGWCR